MLTEEEILNGNILIAKYNGYRELTIEEKCKWVGIPLGKYETYKYPNDLPILMKNEIIPVRYNNDVLFESSLDFHKNWNSLMKIVMRINGKDFVTIYDNRCEITPLIVDDFEKIIVDEEYIDLILLVFWAVVKYIEMRNLKDNDTRKIRNL